jgi:uncharacterized surface protein with fasciclin (FAS1) repeats
MKATIKVFLFAIITLITAANVHAQKNDPIVGNTSMHPSKNIAENISISKNHTTLATAFKAAGLTDTLESPGPFTVFAPINEAFNKLPKGTVETLLKPGNKSILTSILTYHVLAGKIDSKILVGLIKKNNGIYNAKTIQGGELRFWMKGNALMLTDEKGNMAKIIIKNLYQSNGVIHVIDTVLMPK